MKKIIPILSLFLIAGMLLSSCSKDPLDDMTAEESQIYITRRDSSANFSSYKTFSIVDSVAVANNSGEGKELTDDDIKLIKLVKQHMQDRGYVLVDTTQSPDLGINIMRISYTYLNVVPNNYWGYPGYWNTGYWGYPGSSYYFPPSFGYYPPMFRYYNTKSDVLTIDIIDLKNVKKDNKLEAVWNASMKGVGVLHPTFYEEEIDAIFKQSPYLNANK